MPIMLVTREVEVGGLKVPGQPGKLHETLFQTKQRQKKRGGGSDGDVAQW